MRPPDSPQTAPASPRYEPQPSPSPLTLSPRRFPDAPPAFLVRALLRVRAAIQWLARSIGPPELTTFDMAVGAAMTHVLCGIVRTGIADALGDEPLTAEQIAARTGLVPDAVHRTLRACSVKGCFRLRPDGLFEHTALSRTLRSGRLDRTREFVLFFGSGSNLTAWSRFHHALATGHSPFDQHHGMNLWQWFAEHPDEREIFAHAMMGLTVGDAPVIAKLYPFREVASVCDVGGGRGTLLSELLIRHPHLRGVLYEGPDVLESARTLFEARGVLERVDLVSGSFFESVPAGADAYLLKNVLHDWDDATCVKILRIVRAAAAPGARLLVAESIVERDSRDPMGALADLQMMVTCSDGRERGRAEFRRLLADAGFYLERIFEYPTIAVLESIAA